MELANRVENLIVGNIYSYSELCQTLGAEECSGNARIAQKKVWDLYFSLSKVGRKFRITEVFQTLPIERMFKEQHITNSARLLLNYFMEYIESSRFHRVEGCPKLIATLLFGVDIGETCGYFSDQYRYDKGYLEKPAKVEGHPVQDRLNYHSVSGSSVSIFNSIVRETFKDIRNSLLESLLKKRVIQNYRRVLIKLVPNEYKSNKVSKPEILTDDEVSKYNLLLQEFCTKHYPNKPISTFGFSKPHRAEFDSLLRKTFGGTEIFTGYYIAFTEQTVAKELAELEKNELMRSNNGFFKGKVMEKFAGKREKEVGKLEEGKLTKHTEFNKKVYKDNVDKTIADLAKMVDEFL